MMATLLTNGKIQRATHNIMAYRIAVPAKGTFLQVDLYSSLLLACPGVRDEVGLPCVMQRMP